MSISVRELRSPVHNIYSLSQEFVNVCETSSIPNYIGPFYIQRASSGSLSWLTSPRGVSVVMAMRFSETLINTYEILVPSLRSSPNPISLSSVVGSHQKSQDLQSHS
jgi:hypothetical protein